MSAPGGNRSAVTVAVGQIECALGDTGRNVDVCSDAIRRAARDGAELVVLPECAVTGYMFSDAQSARLSACSLVGPEVRQLVAAAAERGTVVVVGMLEADGEDLFNTALLLGPKGVIGRYRKAHIPALGADSFVRRGQTVDAVWDASIARVGLAICYDIRFPESARALALAGAEIIAQPANIGVGGPEITLDHFAPVRAAENSVFLAIANRCDEENGTKFCGKSRILGHDGAVLAEAGGSPEVITAEVDLRLARVKGREIISEENTIHVELFGDRRPDLYQSIIEPPDGEASVPASI